MRNAAPSYAIKCKCELRHLRMRLHNALTLGHVCVCTCSAIASFDDEYAIKYIHNRICEEATVHRGASIFGRIAVECHDDDDDDRMLVDGYGRG